MNITVLDKIEKAWVKLNWREYIDTIQLNNDQLDTLIGLVDNFKSNRRAKEIVLFKYKKMPVYVTIVNSEYVDLLDWIYSKAIHRELYEQCDRILKLKTKLCSNLKKS
jgi:hypothetical protein